MGPYRARLRRVYKGRTATWLWQVSSREDRSVSDHCRKRITDSRPYLAARGGVSRTGDSIESDVRSWPIADRENLSAVCYRLTIVSTALVDHQFIKRGKSMKAIQIGFLTTILFSSALSTLASAVEPWRAASCIGPNSCRCDATAMPSSGSMGGHDWGPDKQTADQAALGACRHYNGGVGKNADSCKITKSTCRPVR